jgi:hypothetical protein
MVSEIKYFREIITFIAEVSFKTKLTNKSAGKFIWTEGSSARTAWLHFNKKWTYLKETNSYLKPQSGAVWLHFHSNRVTDDYSHAVSMPTHRTIFYAWNNEY